jgi:hypothetical protein
MATAQSVMQTFRVTTKLSGSYEALQTLLNKVAADDEYFTWVRSVRLENVEKTSPMKGGIGGPVPVQGAEPDADGKLPMVDASVLFGNEKMKAKLVVDFVRFKSVSSDEADAPADDAGDETPEN